MFNLQAFRRLWMVKSAKFQNLRLRRERFAVRNFRKQFIVLNLFQAILLAQGARIFDVTEEPVEIVYTEAGANVTMPCPGVSERSLVATLEWSCIGCSFSISTGASIKIAKYMGEFKTLVESQKRLTLVPENFAIHFQPVSAEDSGDYYCLVNNRPKPEAVLRLVVQDVPDPPGRPLIMGFTSRTVHLSWAPSLDTHNSPVKNYIIQMRVGEDGDWDAINAIITPDSETSYHVKGLSPYTVYSFRVTAVNAKGPSRPSKESYYMVTLREAPAGKPLITTAHNTSSTSLLISWKPPPRDTIHGEFLGYRISYRPRDKGPEVVKEIYIRDPNIQSHTITGLETYTQYLVSLQVFNPEGPGPVTTVLVMTDEGV